MAKKAPNQLLVLERRLEDDSPGISVPKSTQLIRISSEPPVFHGLPVPVAILWGLYLRSAETLSAQMAGTFLDTNISSQLQYIHATYIIPLHGKAS